MAETKRDQEEQYFAQQELEKRKKLRQKLDQERSGQKTDKLKQEHWMKCPKCGNDLEEKCFADVYIDQCKNCKGIYLDAGELELLLEGRKAKGFISRFLKVTVDDAMVP